MFQIDLEKYFNGHYDNKLNFNQIEKDLFIRIVMSNGTTKTTYDNRLNDVNETLLKYIKHKKEISVNDVAISSGITTIELFNFLNNNLLTVNIVGGDAFLNGCLVNISTKIKALTDENMSLLLFNDENELFGNFHFKRLILSNPLIYLFVIAKLRILKGNITSNLVKKVQLVSRELLKEKNIKIMKDDFFEPKTNLYKKFDVVRAANILNLAYFKKDDLNIAINELKKRVMITGILIVVRTNINGVNNGSLFQKISDTQWELLEDINDGSEVKNLVLNN